MLPPESMKWVALFLLVVQNTALVLLMRSSLTTPGEHYIVTTAVACMECVKVATCLIVEGWSFKRLPDFLSHLRREILKPRELLLLSVPSLLYTLQNNLLYIALANLDAAIYQVCYQLKILTTALFSVLLLKRALNRTKWISLVILTVGVSLTELDAHKMKSSAALAAGEEQSPTLGFLCVLMACLTSGFAGVWFEKILKGVGSRGPPALSGKVAAAAAGTDTSSSSSSLPGPGAATRRLSSTTTTSSPLPPSPSSSSSSLPSSAPMPTSTAAAASSMWIRNIQMGATSVLMALLAVYSKDGALVAEKGFFYGYNRAVVGVILLQALGGLVVALVVVHADNIMKGFGSSISIVLSCTLEWLLFDFQPSLRFVLGAALVNLALYVYQTESLPSLLGGGWGVGSSSSGGGGGKKKDVSASLLGLVGVGVGSSNGSSASTSTTSSSSSSAGGVSNGSLLPLVHTPKSHPRDAKGLFSVVGGARKAAVSPPNPSCLKNGFGSPCSPSSSSSSFSADWRQPHANGCSCSTSSSNSNSSSSGGRGRVGGGGGLKGMV